MDLDKLGERTVALDCDVLEADGGTRTASVTGRVRRAGAGDRQADQERRADHQGCCASRFAATSVGLVHGEIALDLIVTSRTRRRRWTSTWSPPAGGAIVEIPGHRRGRAGSAQEDRHDGGTSPLVGIERLTVLQRKAIAAAGVDLAALSLETAGGMNTVTPGDRGPGPSPAHVLAVSTTSMGKLGEIAALVPAA